jgi:hypothetical protein
VAQVADGRGVPPAQVALAWLLQRPGVSAPIIGATKLEHLQDGLAAEQLELSEDEIKSLEELYVLTAIRAQAEELHRVPDLGESGLACDLVGPALDRLAFHLDAAPAVPAREVMMMGVCPAAPIQDLAGRVPDRVHPARLAEHLEVPVDRRQADRLPALPQLGVDLLGAAEPRQPVKHGRDRLGLPGATDPGALRPPAGPALGEVHNSHGSSQDGKLSPTLACPRPAGG